MLIATFNCNSIRQRLGAVLAWLDAHRPDALALQETKVTDEQFPADAFRETGWHVAYRGEKSYNGVAIVTRDEPADVRFGLGDGDHGESGPRLAALRLGTVHIVNTYVPQGRELNSEAFRFKLDWLARLLRFFERQYDPATDRVAWVGDLNIAPEPRDVHDHDRIWPHVCHCPEVVEVFGTFLDFGFVDVFRKHRAETELFTFWDYRVRSAVERNMGWRIDHVLATPPLAAASTEVVVDMAPRRAEKPSDHTIVAARFDA
jgi:exodeoxyribonuclease-3